MLLSHLDRYPLLSRRFSSSPPKQAKLVSMEKHTAQPGVGVSQQQAYYGVVYTSASSQFGAFSVCLPGQLRGKGGWEERLQSQRVTTEESLGQQKVSFLLRVFLVQSKASIVYQ